MVADYSPHENLYASAKRRLWRHCRAITPFTAALVFYFTVSTGYVALQGTREIGDTWRGQTDFAVFYDAAKVVTGPDRDGLYRNDPQWWIVEKGQPQPSSVGNFFNPPLMAYLLWPFTLFNYQTAKVVFFLASLLSALAVASSSLLWNRSRAYIFVGFAVVFSSWATFMNLWMGQPGLTYAVLPGVALSELERNQEAWAGLWLSSLALKPTLLVGPLVLAIARRRWLACAVAISVAVICILGPFLFLGADALQGYRGLTAHLTTDAFRYKGDITVGAYGLLNWNGYVANLFRTSPSYTVILPLDIAALLLALKAVASGTFREGWLAAVAAGLLVVPHVLAYDWVMLIPAALAVLFERTSRPLVVLLLLVHLGVNLSLYQQAFVWPAHAELHRLGGYWAVPALQGLLFYLAFRRGIDARFGALPSPA